MTAWSDERTTQPSGRRLGCTEGALLCTLYVGYIAPLDRDRYVGPATSATVDRVPTRRLPILAAALGFALGAAACGSGERTSPPTAASDAQPTGLASRVCPPAPHALATVLRREVRRGSELRRLFALRSRADFSDKDPQVRAGVYFVSGNIGPAVFTWAVNARAWRTGAGLIVAADQQTRAVSPTPWVVGLRVLEERYGIGERTEGYVRARACANPTRA